MIAPSRSGRVGRWSRPLSCQLRTEVGHGAGCFHEKSHSFSEKGQWGGVERISQVGKTAVKSEAPALGCKLILLSLRAGRPASSGRNPHPPGRGPALPQTPHCRPGRSAVPVLQSLAEGLIPQPGWLLLEVVWAAGRRGSKPWEWFSRPHRPGVQPPSSKFTTPSLGGFPPHRPTTLRPVLAEWQILHLNLLFYSLRSPHLVKNLVHFQCFPLQRRGGWWKV